LLWWAFLNTAIAGPLRPGDVTISADFKPNVDCPDPPGGKGTRIWYDVTLADNAENSGGEDFHVEVNDANHTNFQEFETKELVGGEWRDRYWTECHASQVERGVDKHYISWYSDDGHHGEIERGETWKFSFIYCGPTTNLDNTIEFIMTEDGDSLPGIPVGGNRPDVPNSPPYTSRDDKGWFGTKVTADTSKVGFVCIMGCETLTPVFCRGKNFYFKLSVYNYTPDVLYGTLTFSAYLGYDCDPMNVLVSIARSRAYHPGTTVQYYYLKVPSSLGSGQYSTSVRGILNPGGYEVGCCMNTDIVQCEPWRIGDNTEWELVEVERPEVELPVFTSLRQNYPNPFNVSTNISYSLAEAENVSLKVYDIAGRLVQTLVDERQEAGEHTVTWDASEHSSGVYFYKLSSGDYSLMKKMNLLK